MPIPFLAPAQGVFYHASSFNGDLNRWDVSNVKLAQVRALVRQCPPTARAGNSRACDAHRRMPQGMFYGAYSFNGNISFWRPSSLRNAFVSCGVLTNTANDHRPHDQTRLSRMAQTTSHPPKRPPLPILHPAAPL